MIATPGRVAHLGAVERDAGTILMEVVIAGTLLSVVFVALMPMVRAAGNAIGFASDSDQAQLALENVAELLRRADFSTLYSTYDGAAIDAPELEGPGGGAAVVQIQCFVDELAVPAEFGPVVDLDGTGSSTSSDCSTTYRLLPVRLSLSYVGVDEVVVTEELFLLLERGS